MTLEKAKAALVGTTFHRDGKSWTVDQKDAEVILGLLWMQGMKAVPLKPTASMVEAGAWIANDAEHVWRSMWNVAEPIESD